MARRHASRGMSIELSGAGGVFDLGKNEIGSGVSPEWKGTMSETSTVRIVRALPPNQRCHARNCGRTEGQTAFQSRENIVIRR